MFPRDLAFRNRHIGGWRAPAALLFLCLCLAPALAEPPPPERWSTLTDTAFKHILVPGTGGDNVFAQDPSGFVWLGTQSGLVRWDGYRMRRYAADRHNPKALRDGFIISMLFDAGGRLWIGTSSGGLARYVAETDNFITYPEGPAGVSHARVSALAHDGAGGVWIGTGAGLDHINAAGVLTRSASGPSQVAGTSIDALLRDRSGALWIGTRHGLFRQADGERVRQPVELPSANATPPAVSVLYQDSVGRIWIGTRNAGAFVLEEPAHDAKQVQESGLQPALQRQRIFSIVEVGPDEIWLGTEGAGIVAVHPGSGATRRIQRRQGVPDSLYDNDVGAMLHERSGLILTASTGAVSQYDPQSKAILTLRTTDATADGHLSIPSMLLRPDGRLWLGVAGGGVSILDPQAGAVGQLRPNPADADTSLPSGRVLAMANGPDGSVYMGTQQGLFRAEGDAGSVKRLAISGRSADVAVGALTFQDQALWIGGLDGLWKISLEAGKPARLLQRETDTLGDTRVTALLAAPDGTLWIGTRAGLARLDASGKVHRIASDPAIAGSLPAGYVSSLRFDRRGRLWVSIFGVGAAVMESNAQGRERFRVLGVVDGLPHAGVNALQEDAQGMMWASTDDGLARIDPATYKIQPLGMAEGVQVREYWTNSSAVTPNGELLFGGASGLTVVRPERLVARRYQAPLVVSEVSVNDVAMPAAPFNRAQVAEGQPAPAIVVAPEARERGFALEFSVLDYTAPERNRYGYRLLGFDKDWINTDASLRRVSYTNLPPGDYTLQLRGANRDGVWSPQLDVAVRAMPLWHQQTWVPALAALVGAILMMSLFQARTAFLRRRQRELQSLVDERTAELQASQQQLEVLAYSDPLTGLPNRRCFNDELRHMGARAVREHHAFTLLLIDLDYFKQINDTLGHDAGDALLVEVAKRLTHAVREADRLARLGGDEFAVLLSNTGEEATVGMVCERIIASMAEPIPFGPDQMRTSVSIGAATFPGGDGDLDALYKTADVALYAAKSAGRNGWRIQGKPEPG